MCIMWKFRRREGARAEHGSGPLTQRWPVAVVGCLVVLCIMFYSLLPSGAVAFLRTEFPWFGNSLGWMETLPDPLNLAHLAVYAGSALLVSLAMPKHVRRIDVVSATAGFVLLAIGTELLQLSVHGRNASLVDAANNLIGVVVGCAVGWALRIWLGRKARRLQLGGRIAAVRDWLASVICRGIVSSGPAPDDELAFVLGLARRHGVVALVHRAMALAQPSSLPAKWLPAFADESRALVAHSLLLRSQCAEVDRAARAADLAPIWLKGVALSTWLYPEPYLRRCADIDVLVPSHTHMLRLSQAVERLGYRLVRRHIAGDLAVYELLARADRRGLELDIHWRLANTPLFAERFGWEELAEAAIPLPGIGRGARGLGPVHALIHACMHRAVERLKSPVDHLHWLYDLHLLAGLLSPAQWTNLVQLAGERRLAVVVLDGLRAAERAFGTALPESAISSLKVGATSEPLRFRHLSNWLYFQWAAGRELPTWQQRFRWVRQVLFPEWAHLRERYGDDGANSVVVAGRRIIDGVRRLWRYIAVGCRHRTQHRAEPDGIR